MFSEIHIPLLRAEIAAARLEAAIGTDPGLEALWRAEATIIEAATSVGMEDIRILEGDLLAKIAENRTIDLDSRGVETAWSVLRFLRAPSDIFKDPVATIRRIEAACANSPTGEGEDAVSDEDILEMMTGLAGLSEAPVACAIRAAAIYGILSQRRSPAAERLVFCAVDAALRGRASPPLDHDQGYGMIAHLHPNGRAGPIVMPATATARAGRAVWSPLRIGAVAALAQALAGGIAYDLGQIGVLRGQVAKLRRIGEGRHASAKVGRLCSWLLTHPVITSASVMSGLGLSRRGALDLIALIEAEGGVRQVTQRRSSRIWATTSLADRLCQRSHGPEVQIRETATAAQAAPVAPAAGEISPQRNLRAENSASVARAMAEMDAAMAEADALLEGVDKARVRG